MGLVPLEKRPQRDPSHLPLWEDTKKRQPSMNQEVGLTKSDTKPASTLNWVF